MKEKGHKEREREMIYKEVRKREGERKKVQNIESWSGGGVRCTHLLCLFYKAPTKIIRKGKKRKNKENE